MKREREKVKGQGAIVRRGLSCVVFHVSRGALVCTLLVGCAIPIVPYRAVYEDPVNYVRLEVDDSVLPEWAPSAHAHPIVMPAEEVARILGNISVKEHQIWLQKWLQGEAPLMPAFRTEELALLSQQIVEALAQARPDERVTFYLSQPRTSAKRVITTGGLYVHGTELHFILGNWQIVYGIPTYGMIYDRRYPMRPTAAKGFHLYFYPAEATIPQRHSLWDTLLANTDDELVIDLTKIASDPIAAVPGP
ncbi:MAG TPA: hypothetical protein VN657_07385 [Nitrospiraceae bacterium]|nr:hypothetical protein [Nitrospiraceae bacterium]